MAQPELFGDACCKSLFTENKTVAMETRRETIFLLPRLDFINCFFFNNALIYTCPMFGSLKPQKWVTIIFNIYCTWQHFPWCLAKILVVWAELYEGLFRVYKIKHINFRCLCLWKTSLETKLQKSQGECILVPVYFENRMSPDQNVTN